jgi:hypothetical protein
MNLPSKQELEEEIERIGVQRRQCSKLLAELKSEEEDLFAKQIALEGMLNNKLYRC